MPYIYMSKFTASTLIGNLSTLSEQLLNPDESLSELINSERQYNAWFNPENVALAVYGTGKMLVAANLQKWLKQYELTCKHSSKRIGLILAGNIPLVGFHDVLCVLVTGNFALIKASSQDARLLRHLLEMLVVINPDFSNTYSFVDRLEKFDAIIATGSNNTSRYFEYYFGKVPHIIRKNRNSIAVLKGDETTEQLYMLGRDIFDYFGLGCRNVSKLYVTEGYNFNHFFESVEIYQPIINHNKYNNNYGYNKSIYLVGTEKHLDNGFLLLKEDERLASPLAVVYYEYYSDITSLEQKLQGLSNNIQCVVTAIPLKVHNQVVDFGKSQQPDLWDYADSVDTMQFLLSIE